MSAYPWGEPTPRSYDDYQFGRYTDWVVPGLSVEFRSKEIAEFVSASQTFVPALVEDLTAANEENARLRAIVSDITKMCAERHELDYNAGEDALGTLDVLDIEEVLERAR